MDTMTIARRRASQSGRTSRYSPVRLGPYPARTAAQPMAVQLPVQPTPPLSPALSLLVDLGLRTVVPVQYQIVKTGGQVLESPAVPGAVKVLVVVVVTAAMVSGGKEIGRVLDNFLS